ncbi:MAG: hypothetical protein Q8885_02210 [Candidatus Phytoplasma stylosanthis]|nr:hypothetical protein [Candidatus Phytoplasma stylosanthis]
MYLLLGICQMFVLACLLMYVDTITTPHSEHPITVNLYTQWHGKIILIENLYSTYPAHVLPHLDGTQYLRYNRRLIIF